MGLWADVLEWERLRQVEGYGSIAPATEGQPYRIGWCDGDDVMSTSAHAIAAVLLRAGAVLLRPEEPFTFASGLRSPIYCDNRLLIGDVGARRTVVTAFEPHCAGAEVVVGTATAGIPWAAWVAQALDLPMAYVRGAAKGHGRGRQVEGA